MELLLNSKTRIDVERFIKKPSHALILEGVAGGGKSTLAKHIASNVLDSDTATLLKNSKLKIVRSTEDTKSKSISIESIREINKFLVLKSIHNQPYNRAVIIENAEQMGHEAQNAFLKNLEEPPSDTVIILTCSNTNQIMSTILSRVQRIKVLPASQKDATEYFSDKFDHRAINKAFLLSEGATGLMTALLENQSDHPLVKNIATAKDIYSKTVFERLNMVDGIAKDKDIPGLLLALERISHAALVSSAKRNDNTVPAWKERLKLILQSQECIQHNPNSKLLLVNLFINL